MRKATLISMLVVLGSLGVRAQQATVQSTAATVQEQPREVAQPGNAGSEVRSAVAPHLDSQPQPAPNQLPSSGGLVQKSAAELPPGGKREED